jgi:hypothetical protein
MGRQGDKNKKKWMKEEHSSEVKAKAVADQVKDMKKNFR